MTVLVLHTGESDGLSAPISFDSIENQVERVIVRGMHSVRTRLEVAVDFVMFLEQREAAVFGPQPDPVASTASDATTVDSRWPLYCSEKRRAVDLGFNIPLYTSIALITKTPKLIKMSSNNSLPTLNDIVSRKCYTESLPDRLPSLGDDVPTAWVPMTNDSYGGMTEVCSPNSVNLYDDCVLWCELPGVYMDAYKDSGSEDFGGYFLRQLRATGMNMSQVGIYSAKEKNAAPAAGRPTGIMALGTLVLVTFIATSI
ncbi:hypothetical protein FSPOR_8406 [Fusarium sporotrichioides]|uniref:Uncharacterized protein n=1 Tax=Fusarium sporotrichioides TaxID=5514 RepID=A0A395RVG8_FUSSP|nr:hypothetical protein FSPOR_8406 [Fusarium sporotrichioides]